MVISISPRFISSTLSIDEIFYENEIFILNACHEINKILITEQDNSKENATDKDKILLLLISVKGKISKLRQDAIQYITKISNESFSNNLHKSKSFEDLYSLISDYASNHDYYDNIGITIRKNFFTEVKSVKEYMDEFKLSNKSSISKAIQNIFGSQDLTQSKFVKEFTKEISNIYESAIYKLNRVEKNSDNYKSCTNAINNISNAYIACIRCIISNARFISGLIK